METAAKFLAQAAAVVLEQLATMQLSEDDRAQLYETELTGKGRKTVLEALNQPEASNQEPEPVICQAQTWLRHQDTGKTRLFEQGQVIPEGFIDPADYVDPADCADPDDTEA